MDGYRKELKFIVGDGVLREAKNRISGLMRQDSHQIGDYYKIRSIYLDSPTYRCLRENKAGISTREKYRIRAYDLNTSKISAEIKIRHNETISKMSADISRDTLDAIINGDYTMAPQLLSNDRQQVVGNGLAEKTFDNYIYRIAGEHFAPAVIVEYERSAFVYDTCNVRITFDRNVAASTEYNRFFEDNLHCVPAIEDGKHVLEIKYDEFLPDEIAMALSGMGLARTSCSKYVRCMNVRI